MNTANLQLEGLLLAIASVHQALVAKGLLTSEELERALALGEQTALGDDRVAEDLSPSNRDAIAFPIRLLRLANTMAADGSTPGFGELARRVGETKGAHNDQQ